MTTRRTEGVESAELFAQHAAVTRFGDLPTEVVEHTKACIADTLAASTAGSGTPEVGAVHDIVTGWGGRPACTVIGFGDKVPAYAAVLVNAAMAHQYDFDDTHDAAVCHPTSATLIAALAMAEAVGGVSGQQLITAVACGNDLVTRLGLAIEGTLWDFPWVRAPVVGIFGAALSAGMVLGLDAGQLRNALGFALPQAAGTLECLEGDVSAVRGMRDGLIYKDAILAVELAFRDLRGDQGVFDGGHGLFRAFFGGRYDRDRLLDRLGEHYEGVNVSLKPWPSCRHTHATLTALFDALAAPGVCVDDIERVTVHVGDGNQHLCRVPGPSYPGRMALLCNVPYAVAVGLAHGGVPLTAFSSAGFAAPAVGEALRRVRCVHDPAQNRLGTIEPGHVELELRSGRVIDAAVEHPLGHPLRPMTRADLAAKVQYAAQASVAPLPGVQADRLLDVVLRLEDVGDVGAVAAMTVPVRAPG